MTSKFIFSSGKTWYEHLSSRVIVKIKWDYLYKASSLVPGLMGSATVASFPPHVSHDIDLHPLVEQGPSVISKIHPVSKNQPNVSQMSEPSKHVFRVCLWWEPNHSRAETGSYSPRSVLSSLFWTRSQAAESRPSQGDVTPGQWLWMRVDVISARLVHENLPCMLPCAQSLASDWVVSALRWPSKPQVEEDRGSISPGP